MSYLIWPSHDPNLPPGCTNADIDRAMGNDDANECEWCGGLCTGTMCKRCIEEERAERKRDELKDELL